MYGTVKTFDKAYIGNKKRNYTYVVEALKDEERILSFMVAKGHSVVESEEADDIHHDIDCYINGVPTSIKAQHSGINMNPRTGSPYNNIYFELVTQHYSASEWDPGMRVKVETWRVNSKVIGFSYATWKPAWFLTGLAEQYLILQGSVLRLYLKSDIERYIARKGWDRVLSLSKARLATQGGKNTACGYLGRDEVPWVAEWTLPKASQEVA